jgi:hypothetical protein
MVHPVAAEYAIQWSKWIALRYSLIIFSPPSRGPWEAAGPLMHYELEGTNVSPLPFAAHHIGQRIPHVV